MYKTPACFLSRHTQTFSKLKLRVTKQYQPFHTNNRLYRPAYNMPSHPKVTEVSALPSSEAKWIEFQKIQWTDQDGKPRVWEAASRKTRGKSGVDAVAISTIIRHPARPPSIIIILQYRPPVDAICVEFPAGLVDQGETPSDASIRELHEETGYKGKLTYISPTIVSDPGMSTANMQLATVEVNLKEGDKDPAQALDDGEHIEKVVVPLDNLFERLEAYSKEGKRVDARLWHWAAGLHFAKTML
jgi:ADP-ribose pyrophosphatase